MDKRAEESAAFSVMVFSLCEKKEGDEETEEEERVQMEILERSQEVRNKHSYLPFTLVDEILV